MDKTLKTGEQNLYLLDTLLPQNEQFYIWCYDRKGKLIGTSCPEKEQESLDYVFRYYDGIQKLCDTPADGTHLPYMIGSEAGCVWAAIPNHVRDDMFNIVIGPVFFSRIDRNQLHLVLLGDHEKPRNSRLLLNFLDHYDSLPVISYAVFVRYAVIVYNILNETKISPADLNESDPEGLKTVVDVSRRDRMKVYQAEKALLQMVRNGDLNYKQALQNSTNISSGVQMHGKDPLRQVKTSVIVFISLVCRAAMEGGLSPETAYAINDAYIQSVEDCRDSAELNILSYAMYHDFIYRVHQLHVSPGCSHTIQKCLDYIDLHICDKITTQDLAALVGYTEYYLSEKFKKETGVSVSNYIRSAKIERAKVMLETGTESVADIADSLSFNTPNYFIQCFKAITGLTPAQYRAKKAS